MASRSVVGGSFALLGLLVLSGSLLLTLRPRCDPPHYMCELDMAQEFGAIGLFLGALIVVAGTALAFTNGRKPQGPDPPLFVGGRR